MDQERDIPACPWCGCTDDCECEKEDTSADDDLEYELFRDQEDRPVPDPMLDDEPEDDGDSFFNELDPPDE